MPGNTLLDGAREHCVLSQVVNKRVKVDLNLREKKAASQQVSKPYE